MNEHSAYTSPLDLNFAWLAVREVAKRARARGLLSDRIGFAWDVSGSMREAPLEQAQL